MKEEKEEDEDISICQRPCHPDSGCAECAGYWTLMINEGYWDKDCRRWTDNGWREICK